MNKDLQEKLQVFFYAGFGIKECALKIEFDIIVGS